MQNTDLIMKIGLVIQKKSIMEVKKYVLSSDQLLTEEHKRMVKEAGRRSVIFDEDNPELTDEQLASFRRAHESRQESRSRR